MSAFSVFVFRTYALRPDIVRLESCQIERWGWRFCERWMLGHAARGFDAHASDGILICKRIDLKKARWKREAFCS